jgi:hypothetical protein
MSDQPTPETDDLLLSQIKNREKHNDWLGRLNEVIPLCRQLERQRNQYRDLTRELRDALDGHDTMAIEYSDWQRRAKAALDKANNFL